MKLQSLRRAEGGQRRAWAGLLCLCVGLQAVSAADFTVSAPGNFFRINGQGPNPTLTLVRGRTYTFASITLCGFHPFNIGTFVGGPTPPGVSGSPACDPDTVTFNVPADAANCVYYCSVHFFSGSIVMIDPPPPPTIRIVGLTVSSNIVLTSTGTNTWSVFPEYTTNLIGTNWFALTVQTNTFASGTNETICGRPNGDSVFIRIRAQQN